MWRALAYWVREGAVFGPQENERTAQYRFWFDVREPGASAYAAKLGTFAIALFGVSGAMQLFVQGHWFKGLIWLALLLRTSGGMRQLAPWAGVATVIAVPGFYWITIGHLGFVPRIDGLALIQMIGLPPALWAIWIQRELPTVERRRVAQVPEAVPGRVGTIGKVLGYAVKR